jgi:hypothetical protein
MEDPLVLHPWYVVTFSTLKNLLASADLAALWGCLGCGGIVGFGLRDLDGMGVESITRKREIFRGQFFDMLQNINSSQNI